MSFTVYILRTSSNTLYIGQTNNLEKRLLEHQSKLSKSAKYMRCFSSFKLVYSEKYKTRTEAMKREYQLKQLTKAQKEALIAGKKVLFIIPGYTHKAEDKPYRKIRELFEEKGFTVIPVQINWKDTIISENVIHFLKEYKKTKASKTYVLGFSFGAMIAYLASAKTHFISQILCSMSPYFQEDLPYIKKSWIKSIGKRRFEDFSQINNSRVSSRVKTPTIILYGTKEGEFIVKRSKETFQSLMCKKELIPLEGVKHDIGDKRYLGQIKLIAEHLST